MSYLGVNIGALTVKVGGSSRQKCQVLINQGLRQGLHTDVCEVTEKLGLTGATLLRPFRTEHDATPFSKTYHGREMAAGAMLSEETSPLRLPLETGGWGDAEIRLQNLIFSRMANP